jgi:hypothetical protein
MRVGVVFNGVTLRDDPAAKGGILFGFSSDDEKCSLRIVLSKQIQDAWSAFGVGAVVDCEPDRALWSVEMSEHFTIPWAVSSKRRIQPEKIVYAPGDGARPSAHRKDAQDGGEPTG